VLGAAIAVTAATEARVDELRVSFGDELVEPGDPTYYDHCKVWNGSIDRHLR
jgi:hypothetical protein